MSSKSKIKPWLYSDEPSGKFLMLPPELYTEQAFISLSHAAREFYTMLNAHRETDEQRQCLFATLHEYNRILNLGMTDEDILNEAMPNKHTKYNSGFVVIPQGQLEQYGYSPQYANKLKKELIAAGFLKVAYGGKGKYNGWHNNTTVYQFISGWKTKSQ